MKIAVIIVRVLMGLMFLWASIAYFFKLVEPEGPIPQDTITYMSGISVVYLLDIVKSIELLCAISFLTGRYVALSTVVLFPIMLNILLLHAIVDGISAGTFTAVVLLALHLFLFYAYRKHYTALFKASRIE